METSETAFGHAFETKKESISRVFFNLAGYKGVGACLRRLRFF